MMSPRHKPRVLALVKPETSGRALPIFWDGAPVLWDGWKPVPLTSMRFHRRVKTLSGGDDVCHGCGSAETFTRMAKGLRSVKVCTWAEFEKERAKHGTARRLGVSRPSPGLWDLLAFRCAHCGADRVLESMANGRFVHWELDESDYGPEGSWVLGQGSLL